MAFYKDLTGKTRQEKQHQAESKGGFDDEGSRYSGAHGKSNSSRYGKPSGGSHYGRPAEGGNGGNRYGKPAEGGNGGNRYGRPTEGGNGGNRYGKPAEGGNGGNRYGRPTEGGNGGNRYGRPTEGGNGGNRYGRPTEGGNGGNRYGRPTEGGNGGNRYGRPTEGSNGGNRYGKPSGGSFDRQPGKRYDDRPRNNEENRGFRDYTRSTPQGERTVDRGAPRDFNKKGNYRFTANEPTRYNDRGAGVTPRSYDEQRKNRTQDEPRYNSYRYAAPVAPAAPATYDAAPDSEVIPNENLLSGRNPIREALKSGRDIEKMLVARGDLSGSAREIVQMAKERHIPVQEVDRTRLDAITHNHQGMLAFASAYQYSSLEAMLALAAERGEEPFLILLDGITDPHNLGAIIRTAECAGAHGVIVQERRAVGLTPAAVKASAGAIEHLPVARVTNLSVTIETLKEKNIWVYAADMEGEDYDKTDFKGAVALVIGAEGEGVGRRVLETCDKAVSIPLKGQLDSLNASVAAGILMYAVMRAR